MLPANDRLLSRLTVRLRDINSAQVLGSGVLYPIKDKVYVLTAAHCFYADKDAFQELLSKVIIDLYHPATDSYVSFEEDIDPKLVNPAIDADVGILLLDRAAIENRIGEIPTVAVIAERQSITEFVVKGFPNATQGKELDLIRPVWKQEMTGVPKFQLQLNENYNGWATKGFSGSGIFLHTHDEVYLYGIFTRFRPEEMGKVIYAQFLGTINDLLTANWLPTIPFSFFGQHGLNATFFNRHTTTAVKNLGPRFNKELNVKMPVSKLFNVIAKDEHFKLRVLTMFDAYLLAKTNSRFDATNEIVKVVEDAFKDTQRYIGDWLNGLSWLPGTPMHFVKVTEKIEHLSELVAQKREQLYELRHEIQKTEVRKERDYSYRPPYESEIDRLYEIGSANDKLLIGMNNASLELADSPFLFIKGDAGCGKSHLLGDIATMRAMRSRPTLLLLGQHFKREHSVWKNILEQLHLSCTKDELLNTLNDIGRQIGSRILILIDALNEGDGKAIWPNELAGLISEIGQYPYIGLIMTVRSIYWDAIIPKSVQNMGINQITHEGFKGNEYDALKLFCVYYDIKQPNFPILAPEFANPLFLQLVCEGVKASPDKKFPQGFQGISRLFGFYISAVNQKLTEKREEYALRTTLAEVAIMELARACFDNQSRTILLETAVALFDTRFPHHRMLLNDLIQENVFIQSISKNYDTDTDEDIVYFSYERFGDFFIAKELLKGYSTVKQVTDAFLREGPLGQLLVENYYLNNGILEAMAVILPEQFQLEITEVYNWAFTDDEEHTRWIASEWVNNWLIDSLKWRTVDSTDVDKLSNWFNSEECNIDLYQLLNVMVELVPVKGHAFNSDYLLAWFMRFSMAKRDGFLQQFFYYYKGEDDNGSPYPVRRLIEWAWQPGISALINEETARLTGQFLSWVLSVTQRQLRDQATKAMVNLLEEQPGALISILKAFEQVDDLYILERLYAVAYGCALRTSQHTALKQIAQYIYDTTFATCNPPAHILLRDYARNTVEYAIYQNLLLEGDMAKIQPPYNSPMPDNMPSEDDMAIYKLDHNAEGFKINYGNQYNRIRFSVLEWDFGRYVIDHAFSEFSHYSFRIEDEVNSFLKKLKPEKRSLVKSIITLYEDLAYIKQNEKAGRVYKPLADGKVIGDLYEELLELAVDMIEKVMAETEREFIASRLIPYLENKMHSQDGWRHAFETRPYKRWIVRRVFELGYNVKLHGEYDSLTESYNSRSENKVERIGKKYQWIALHEILARTTDNYKLCEGWSNKPRLSFYQGPWQKDFRDIDPAFTTPKPGKDDEDGDEQDMLGIVEQTTTWWLPEPYIYWNQSNSEWIRNTQDMPDPRTILLRRDEHNEDWLYLYLNIYYNEPKPIGADKYHRLRKDMWYCFHAYLVKKSNKEKIIRWLEKQNFYGRWMPESQSHTDLLNRENYWSPASKYYQKQQKTWQQLEGSRHRVITATAAAVGELSGDKSGAHFSYMMPCHTIFEGMGLKYAERDGDFKNANGEIIVSNINPHGVLIRKKDLLTFLEQSGLEIVWTLLGEKNVLNVWDNSGNHSEEAYFKTISGVYALKDDSHISGNFYMLDR